MPIPLNLAYDERYVQFDYVARIDGNPVYAAFSSPGTLDGDNRWTLKKYTYDVNNQCTKIEIAFKANWTNRATILP